MPPGIGRDIVCQRPQVLLELRIRGARGHGDDRHAHSKTVHLPADQDELLDVAGCVEPIRVASLDLGEHVGEIHRAGRVEAVEHDVEAILGGEGSHLARDRLREQRVEGEYRDLLRLRHARLVELHLDLGHGLARKQNAEQILLLLVVDRVGSRGGGDHGNGVTLRQHRSGLGVSGAVGSEEEIDLVHREQPLNDLYRAAGLALIIVFNRFDLALLVADLHAAFGVDGVDAHVEALLLLAALVGKAAGEGEGSADADRVGGQRQSRRAQQGGSGETERGELSETPGHVSPP